MLECEKCHGMGNIGRQQADGSFKVQVCDECEGRGDYEVYGDD